MDAPVPTSEFVNTGDTNSEVQVQCTERRAVFCDLGADLMSAGRELVADLGTSRHLFGLNEVEMNSS